MLHCQFLYHVLKALFFITIALNLSYFCKKMQNYWALGALPPDLCASRGWGFAPRPPASGGWGLRPQTPKTAPPLRISGYAPVLGIAYLTEYVSISVIYLTKLILKKPTSSEYMQAKIAKIFFEIRKNNTLITVKWSEKKPHLLNNFCVENRR